MLETQKKSIHGYPGLPKYSFIRSMVIPSHTHLVADPDYKIEIIT